MAQLTTIPILQQDYAVLDDFIGAQNLQIKQNIAQLLAGDSQAIFYFYGGQSTGKTHLLQAYYLHAINIDIKATYLNCSVDILNQTKVDELLKFDWFCIDNIHTSDKEAQYALYSLYNAVRFGKKTLMLSGDVAPSSLGIGLNDLKTRLDLAHRFELAVLDNDDKKQILDQKMRQQKIRIHPDIYDYLLLNHSRDLSTLVKTLTIINTTAIKQGKKYISLSFVKKWHKPHLC